MKRFTFFVLLCMIAQIMAAEVKAEDAPSGEISLFVTTIYELNLKFIEHFQSPFLQGESALTKNNNIDLALGAEISPISINGVFEAVCTPIAFFQLSAGGRAGSGWTLEFNGEKLYGIGINYADASGMAKTDGDAFDGVIYKVHAGGTLRFDFDAISPGDWHHLILMTYHEINYRGYTKAKKYESWYEEDDDGENINGCNYYANLFIGYQMPAFVSMAGVLAEADYYVSHRSAHKEWGDEKTQWTFSGIVAFGITEQITLATLTQFRTRVNYDEVKDWEDIYYRDRDLDASKSRQRVEFYRFVASVNYKF